MSNSGVLNVHPLVFYVLLVGLTPSSYIHNTANTRASICGPYRHSPIVLPHSKIYSDFTDICLHENLRDCYLKQIFVINTSFKV